MGIFEGNRSILCKLVDGTIFFLKSQAVQTYLNNQKTMNQEDSRYENLLQLQKRLRELPNDNQLRVSQQDFINLTHGELKLNVSIKNYYSEATLAIDIMSSIVNIDFQVTINPHYIYNFNYRGNTGQTKFTLQTTKLTGTMNPLSSGKTTYAAFILNGNSGYLTVEDDSHTTVGVFTGPKGTFIEGFIAKGTIQQVAKKETVLSSGVSQENLVELSKYGVFYEKPKLQQE